MSLGKKIGVMVLIARVVGVLNGHLVHVPSRVAGIFGAIRAYRINQALDMDQINLVFQHLAAQRLLDE